MNQSMEMNKKDSITKKILLMNESLFQLNSHYVNDTHEFCCFITEVLNLWAPTVLKDPMTFPFVCD